MAKIIYLHGFKSSGDSEKSKQLKKAFPNDKVIAPNLSASPKQAIQQIHNIIADNPEPTIVVGTSLGGFYATYIACLYDIPAFVINPSLEPHVSLVNQIGKHQRYGTGEDYEFHSHYIDELKSLFDKLHSSEIESQNLHFYLADNDDVVTFDKLDTLFPDRAHVKTFKGAGHRFSAFPEIFPDIQKVLDKFKK